MKIYDLSLTINDNMLVWPGSTKAKITVKAKGEGFYTKINILSHTGTHVDSQRHYAKRGKTVEKIEIDKLVGPAKVIDLTNFFKMGGPAEIGWAHFEKAGVRKGDRLLVKTGNHKLLIGNKFSNDYISLSKDAAKNLIKRQVSLIGIDYLGIEKRGNPGHPVHKTLLNEGVVIIEGLDLEKVPAGDYLLVCAPLKLEGADASPARVFLIKE